MCVLIACNLMFSQDKSENKDNTVKGKKKTTFVLSIGAGMKMISENICKEIYGSTNLVLSADLGFRIGKSLELFLHTDNLSLKGETTTTKEKTSFKLSPIEFGLRFLMEKKKISPYIGAGGGFYSYKDEIQFQDEVSKVSGNQFGFFTEAGFRYGFTKSFFFDLKVKYIFLDVEPDAPEENTNGSIYPEKRNLGGFAIIAAIGISI